MKTLLALILVILLTSCVSTKYTTNYKITKDNRSYYTNNYKIIDSTISFVTIYRNGTTQSHVIKHPCKIVKSK